LAFCSFLFLQKNLAWRNSSVIHTGFADSYKRTFVFLLFHDHLVLSKLDNFSCGVLMIGLYGNLLDVIVLIPMLLLQITEVILIVLF
jgi:hypothetical protein